jgi:hypothetical protein
MPTRFPGDDPAGTIETLGLPPRAVTALARAGITDVAALAALTRSELTAVPGLGPGLVAAIRRVVPEPPAPDPAGPRPGVAVDDEDAPTAPEIPSFASLRDPRRRSALDLLVPGPTPPAREPEPAPAALPAPDPAAPPAGPRTPQRDATAPRPAEYADLLRLGLHLTRTTVAVPGRLAVWAVRTQVGVLRRLLGG